MTRPSFDEVALQIAQDISQRSTCPRLHTAAVICTPDNRIIATGYNGSLPGQPHCDGSDGLGASCEMIDGHCLRTVHAEANALMQAAKYGIAVRYCGMYVLHRPCVQCTKLIISAGIAVITWSEEYQHDREVDIAERMLILAGIRTIILPKSYQPLQTPVDS